jgi:predicted MPP superfamily phosphohydrolase
MALSAGGCGSDAEPSEAPPTPAPIASTDPIAQIPRAELYGASPVENLWSPRFELEVPNLPAGWGGARLAIISDLQLGLWEENEAVAAAAVRMAVEANPDVVLLVGDYLARGEDVAMVERVLSPLRGRTVVAVLGDNDVRTDTLEAQIGGILRGLGFQLLQNSVVSLERGGESILIAGLDPDIVAETWEEQQYILAVLGEPGRTPILLTHLPALATRAPANRYPIIVGGNTFCGQVEVPGTPRLSWLRNEVFPGGQIEGLDQLFRVQGSTVLVTCGVGYGFVPLRYGAAPEVPILTLARIADPLAEEPAESALPDSLIDRFREQTPESVQDSTVVEPL